MLGVWGYEGLPLVVDKPWGPSGLDAIGRWMRSVQCDNATSPC